MERQLKFCAVIPTRGSERQVFVDWQLHRAEQLGFDDIILVNYQPIDDTIDLYQRLAVGFNKALSAGHDFVSVIEDDDYYDLSYLDRIRSVASRTVDMIGFDRTTYYHLGTGGYKQMIHPGRSSLFATTVAVNVFHKLDKSCSPYYDMAWWRQAQTGLSWRLLAEEPFLGIKHGIGKTGGNGHRTGMYQIKDNVQRDFLRSRVDARAFEFYKSIRL
jgi:hypothetical protein